MERGIGILFLLPGEEVSLIVLVRADLEVTSRSKYAAAVSDCDAKSNSKDLHSHLLH